MESSNKSFDEGVIHTRNLRVLGYPYRALASLILNNSGASLISQKQWKIFCKVNLSLF